MKIDDCSALITGASAGIGREFAIQLAHRAKRLVLIARRRDRLESLRNELLQAHPDLHVDIHTVDLAEKSQIEQFVRALQQENVEIDFLINNAGLGDLGSFETADVERLDRIIQVNVSALTIVTRHLLPAMVARKRGAILNVSSSAGFLPIPTFGVYAASKAYVTSFSEALRAELFGTGVYVTAVCPGPVHTEFTQVATRAGQPRDRSPQIAHVSVERVVTDALTAIEHNQPVVIPGFIMKLGMLLVRMMPMSILRLGWRFAKRN